MIQIQQDIYTPRVERQHRPTDEAVTKGETGRKLGILVGLECAEEVSSLSVVVWVSARCTLIIVVVAIFPDRFRDIFGQNRDVYSDKVGGQSGGCEAGG